MLNAFLNDNKISIAKLTEQTAALEIRIDKRQQKPSSEPIISAAKSPTFKRRKIFDRVASPQSKITADFRLPTDSFVEKYEIPSLKDQCVPQSKATRAKPKVNKENGLCLARVKSEDSIRRYTSMKTISTVQEERLQPHKQSVWNGECQRQKRVQQLQNYNKSLLQSIEENKNVLGEKEDSLVIENAFANNFTFHSENSSLLYSHSGFGKDKYLSNKKVLSSPLEL